jgi:hypothetical protein
MFVTSVSPRDKVSYARDRGFAPSSCARLNTMSCANESRKMMRRDTHSIRWRDPRGCEDDPIEWSFFFREIRLTTCEWTWKNQAMVTNANAMDAYIASADTN